MTDKLPPLPKGAFGKDSMFYADQMRAYGLECRRLALEEAEASVKALRDDHCRSTKQTVGSVEVECLPDGSCGCEFVAAWNDAIAAIRSLQNEQQRTE